MAAKAALAKIPTKPTDAPPSPNYARRDAVVLEHLPLVRAIAIRVHEGLPVYVDLDDLIHAGMMGLMDAAMKFDLDKKVAFSAYAKHRIKGAILDSLRQMDWASRDLRRRYKQVESIIRDLAGELHRQPTEEEVAERMNIPVSRWRKMSMEMRSVGLFSSSARHQDDDMPAPDFPASPRLHPDRVCGEEQLRTRLAGAIAKLPARYQTVVKLYYVKDMTMKEIGGVLGINESRVSQIHKAPLANMQNSLQQAGIGSAAAFSH